jgi:hypothetical protein
MWISLEKVTNPNENGSYPISVESFTKNNERIDKGEALITISTTVGKPEKFNVYAVKREDELRAGNTGPFHLLLMLTNNLPKTNDTEETWSWIKIYIEEHIPLNTQGHLKCYFHDYYPCSFVTWTALDGIGPPTRTIIILKTPTNIDF